MTDQNYKNIRIIYKSNNEKKNNQSRSALQVKEGPYEKYLEQQSTLFSGKCDYRDEVIRIPLSFQINKEEYINDPSKYEEPILDWLVNVVENIISIAFRLILQEKLSVNQGKAYAAKNILLNVKELCLYINGEILGTVDQAFMYFLDNSIGEVINIVINKYPQTNAKTASKRILKYIHKISQRENDQYDFLHINNLSIRFKNSGDYSSQIMKIINTIINTPLVQSTNQDTLAEEYQEFCKKLFYSAHVKDIAVNQSFNQYLPKPFQSLQSIDLDLVLTYVRQTQNLVESVGHQKIKESGQKTNLLKQMAKNIIQRQLQRDQDFLRFQKQKSGLFLIGQKIPSQVKSFSREQIRQGQFNIYHASVLRVLTKWSQELNDKLQKANQLIRSRIHKFKTNDGKLIFLSLKEKQYLYQQSLQQKNRIKEYFEQLKNQNKILQSAFACQNIEGKFLKKFTTTGIFAGKLQKIVSQYTFRYLNQLIHSLLRLPIEASEKIYQNQFGIQKNKEMAQNYRSSLKDVNLVTFKVGDLLRAKYSCQQYQFVNILNLLYAIEQRNAKYLKIIRIGNRMFQKDNDILINLFFKSKVICELQLSIHKQENKKQKLYGNFNHFIYQLKRSKFGIISQISNIIAQHDPIVNYFTFVGQKPPKTKQKALKYYPSIKNTMKKSDEIKRKNSQGILVNLSLIEKPIQRPFICQKCHQLKIVNNPKFYYRESQAKMICNQCIQTLLYATLQDRTNNICLFTDGSIFVKDKQLIFMNLFKYCIVDQLLQQFISKIFLWDPKKVLATSKNQRQLYVQFIDYGFIIQKGTKIPKVRYFKTFYNRVSNNVILSTIINGQVQNFVHFNCQKDHNNNYLWQKTLQKYLIFQLGTNKMQQILNIFKVYISQDDAVRQTTQIFNLIEQDIMKNQYKAYILSTIEKHYSTLNLNGYKNVLTFLYDYLNPKDPQKKAGRLFLVKNCQKYIKNLLLESTEITTLYPFLQIFTNLKEINLSSNRMRQLQHLNKLYSLQTIDVSNNRLQSLRSLTSMSWLKSIKAKNNNIRQLKGINKIKSLKFLTLSSNNISDISQLQGLRQLEDIRLGKNKIINMKGIMNLKQLRILKMNNNFIEDVGNNIQLLQKLIYVNFSYNQLKQFPQFIKHHFLKELYVNNNKISKIRSNSLKSLEILDISSNYIQVLENMEQLENLHNFNISYNSISQISNLQNLKKLRTLNISHNNISIIDNLNVLSNIQSINLQNNPLINISPLKFITTLYYLYINNCQLSSIEPINKFKQIKILSLSDNRITQIKFLDQLVKIQRLDLSNNLISKIENLSSFKMLQHLSLYNNEITKIEGLDSLLQMYWLILSKNQIKKIQGLQNLKQLSILQLENNQIQKIQGLQELFQLNQLNLSNNNILEIANLYELTNLKKLLLGRNKISKIKNLQRLANLEVLDMQGNRILRIQGLDGLHHLKWLILSDNEIEVIENLDNLTQLSKLFLADSKISKIQNISKLKQLQVLYLHNNKISQIEGLQQMQGLLKLIISHNNLQKIQNLQNLKQLQQLNLQSNKIQKIQKLSYLNKLKKLNLSNNKIRVIENIQNLKQLSIFSIESNLIQSITGIQQLHYLSQIFIFNNPINQEESFLLLEQNIKLSLSSIAQITDNFSSRRSLPSEGNHPYYSPIIKRQSVSEEQHPPVELKEKIIKKPKGYMVYNFAKNFFKSPQ